MHYRTFDLITDMMSDDELIVFHEVLRLARGTEGAKCDGVVEY